MIQLGLWGAQTLWLAGPVFSYCSTPQNTLVGCCWCSLPPGHTGIDFHSLELYPWLQRAGRLLLPRPYVWGWEWWRNSEGRFLCGYRSPPQASEFNQQLWHLHGVNCTEWTCLRNKERGQARIVLHNFNHMLLEPQRDSEASYLFYGQGGLDPMISSSSHRETASDSLESRIDCVPWFAQ